MNGVEYKNMTNVLNEKSQNDYSIEKYTITDNDIRAHIDGIPNGRYVGLYHHGEVLMSNTPMEKRTNMTFIQSANGDVLIGGLGIGLIVLPLLDKDDIKSITIIEKSQDVIDIVASQLPLTDKVKIICADVFEYTPTKKYDCIYMDIWPYVNSDVYHEEMLPLKNKYKKYLVKKSENPNRYIGCWAEMEARYNRRLY